MRFFFFTRCFFFEKKKHMFSQFTSFYLQKALVGKRSCFSSMLELLVWVFGRCALTLPSRQERLLLINVEDSFSLASRLLGSFSAASRLLFGCAPLPFMTNFQKFADNCWRQKRDTPPCEYTFSPKQKIHGAKAVAVAAYFQRWLYRWRQLTLAS